MNYTYDEAYKNSLGYFNNDSLAAKVFVDKYALRDNLNNILEDTPEKMHRRLAKEFARIEGKKFLNPLSEDKIFSLFDKFRYIVPQGSPMFGIGNDYQICSISNCYVLEEPEDSYSGILNIDEQLVNISKRRGGVGISLDNLRPKDTPTTNAAKSSTGIVSWMERYSNSIREVGQHGRRGALMLTLSVHHPDIVDFATIKNDNTKVTGANISVKLSKEFLDAVKSDSLYEQRWESKDGKLKISRMVSAKEIWKIIIHSAWLRAEPGLLMWDNIINEGVADLYEEYRSICTNPCQPSWAKVLTKDGIKEFKDIDIGTEIWSKEGWTKVINKWSTGINKVYKYTTNASIFYGTEDHRLLSNNEKIKAKEAESIDIFSGPEISNQNINIQDVMDGLVIGDGTYHKASDLIVLYIGNDDSDYFNSEIKKLIIEHRTGIDDKSYSIQTTITNEELPRLPNRKIPERFLTKNRICGFLRGLYSANGSVCDNRITLKSSCLDLIEQVQLMLNSIGIRSYYTINKPKKVTFDNGEYLCKQSYDLNITIDKDKFVRNIGFIQNYKNEKIKLNKGYKPAKETFDITSVQLISEEETFDITVDNKSHTYWTQGCNVSNCSEISLSALDSCRLLCLNLFSYVVNPFTDRAYFDYALFYEHSQIAQRLMDNLVDLESEKIDKIIAKIESDPEPVSVKAKELEMWRKIQKFNNEGRRTGLGITALGDTLAALNISYGSEGSIATTGIIYNTLKLGAYRASVDMAKELGPFKIWNSEIEKNSSFLNRFKNEYIDRSIPNFDNTEIFNAVKPIFGKEIYDDMQKYGRRNIALITTAPTGSVSCLTQTSSGIEPIFMIGYTRRKKVNPNDKNVRIDFVDENGDSWQEFTIYHPKVNLWMEITGKTDITESPWYNCCAEEINWINRVKLQAAAQKHVCHAISSTINLPEDISEEKVAEIYQSAFENGLKGITVYRKNSRSGVLVETKKEVKTEKYQQRPKTLNCDIHNISVNKDKYTVIVGLLDNKPYEVFCVHGFIEKHKHGKITKKAKGQYIVTVEDKDIILSNYLEDDTQNALLRLISTCLRHGADILFVVEQLQKTEGSFMAFNKCIARALKKYINDGSNSSEKCSCGSELIYQEGCLICKSCGYSKCS
jgi:ribonucleotide reductase alpha subunit